MAVWTVAGAGFLLAVLWFDLMFDVQVRGHRGAVLPDIVLDSIARYYRRVTTTARPMNRLVMVAMLGTITSLVVAMVRGDGPAWARFTSLPLAAAPVTLAATRTFPSAVRLGQRRDPPERQSMLARGILRDHLLCLAAIAALLVVQLGWGPR